MAIVIKIVQITGTLFGVAGLIGVLLGFMDFQSGTKNEDSMKSEKGSQRMLWGGATAAIATGVVAVIVAALKAVKF